jgi:hypothetical protein
LVEILLVGGWATGPKQPTLSEVKHILKDVRPGWSREKVEKLLTKHKIDHSYSKMDRWLAFELIKMRKENPRRYSGVVIVLIPGTWLGSLQQGDIYIEFYFDHKDKLVKYKLDANHLLVIERQDLPL